MTEEIDTLLSFMDKEIETIQDTVSDIIDIANLPGNTVQVRDLLIRASDIIKNGAITCKIDSFKIKTLIKNPSRKDDVPSSSEVQMTDENFEDSQKTMEETLSFRPNSGKTIFIEKQILIHIPVQQAYVENQTSLMRELYNLSGTDFVTPR